VDHDVDAAEQRLRRARQGIDRLLRSDVGGERVRLDARFAQLYNGLLELCPLARDQHEPRAAPTELGRQRPPQALAAAGDHDALVLKVHRSLLAPRRPVRRHADRMRRADTMLERLLSHWRNASVVA
jgi:hypothetical protein